MPGIHFYFDGKGNAAQKEPLIFGAAGSLLHEEWFKRKTVSSSSSHLLSYTYHPAYPVSVFENSEYYICLEGRIYGRTAARIDASLSGLAGILFRPQGPAAAEAAGWLRSTDGDFTIFMLEKGSGRMRILNDALGRLPLYIFQGGGKTVLSRELRFITSLLGGMRFDRTAMGLYLLFGYIPGASSLIEGVSRVEPATLLAIDPPGRGESITKLVTFDFEKMIRPGGTLEERSEELIGIFRKAARDRAAENGINVLALSGGLDSRSAAAALKGEGVPFTGATFLDHYETAAADVDMARTVSYELGFDWRLFPLKMATGRDVLRLLREKSGMNYLGMSFSIPLFDAIRAQWGPAITYFTGEGGGLTVPDTRPFRKIRDLDDLTGFVIERNAMMPAAAAASIAGIDPANLRGSLREILREYPEMDTGMRYAHFIVCERNQKWTADGEDRNRFFFWTVSPFNSVPFFDCVMSCPPEMKSMHKLYSAFLTGLSPEAAALKNVSWNLPLSGRSRLLYFYGRELYFRMPAAARRLVRRRLKSSSDVTPPYGPGSPFMECLSRELAAGEPAAGYLSNDAVERSLPGMGKLGMDHIFTLSSVIEDLTSGRSSIESYLDTPLI